MPKDLATRSMIEFRDALAEERKADDADLEITDPKAWVAIQRRVNRARAAAAAAPASMLNDIAEFRAATKSYDEGPAETPAGLMMLSARYALWDRVFYRDPKTMEELIAQSRLILQDRVVADPHLINCEVIDRFMRRLPKLLRRLTQEQPKRKVPARRRNYASLRKAA